MANNVFYELTRTFDDNYLSNSFLSTRKHLCRIGRNSLKATETFRRMESADNVAIGLWNVKCWLIKLQLKVVFVPHKYDKFKTLASPYICRALLVAFMRVGLWISPRISRAHISWA